MAAADFVYKVVALAVFVLITATVLIPVIDDVENNITTNMQNTSMLYSAIDDTSSYTMEFSDGTLTVNGVSVPYESTQATLMISDKFVIMSGSASSFYNYDTGKRAAYSSISVSISGSTASVSINGGDATSVSFDWAYGVSNSGDYGVFKPTESNPLYVTHGGTIFAAYPASTSAATGIYEVTTGVINTDDPIYSLHYTSSGNLAAAENVALSSGYDSDKSDSVTDVYTGVPTASFTESGSSTVESLTGNYIAPLKYIGHSTNDESMISLFGIIPILVIVAAIIMAVGLMKGRS